MLMGADGLIPDNISAGAKIFLCNVEFMLNEATCSCVSTRHTAVPNRSISLVSPPQFVDLGWDRTRKLLILPLTSHVLSDIPVPNSNVVPFF